MGGDRDGNPNVTAKVTREVCYLARWIAADLYLREIDTLRFELSMDKCNDKLARLAEELRAAGEELRGKCEASVSWFGVAKIFSTCMETSISGPAPNVARAIGS